jgi:Uma2 family endonuclease
MLALEEYLRSSYPDGDREFLDGLLVKRKLGAPDHSAMQVVLVSHFARLQPEFAIDVRPSCRIRISDDRYRVPDILVMKVPFRRNKRVILDAPLIVVEIVSPDDRVRDTMQRFRDYAALGVRNIIQMDPEDRTTFVFESGNVISRDLKTLDLGDGILLPFDTQQLFSQLEED